jgi:hypothetical protein
MVKKSTIDRIKRLEGALSAQEHAKRKAQQRFDDEFQIRWDSLNDEQRFQTLILLHRLGVGVDDFWLLSEKDFCIDAKETFISTMQVLWNWQFPDAGDPEYQPIARERVLSQLQKTADELAWGGKIYASMLVVDFVQKAKDSTGPFQAAG